MKENNYNFKLNIKDLTFSGLEEFIINLGARKYRAVQIAGWVFKKGIFSFQEMTDLPVDLRVRLAGAACVSRPVILAKQVSKGGSTVKYLFSLQDGQTVESVLMRHDYGMSVCVSTQAGCRFACRFCASGLGGLVRSLSPGEIYDQVLGIREDSGERISHLVIMGTGEPLDNYTATLAFIKHIAAPYGLNISYRRITLSTCGLVPGIKELAKERLPLTLAVSLHAPNDSLRNHLMPVNKMHPLRELMKACREYAGVTGRRITFEYALIAGINDSREHANELGQLLSGMLCHVNLIPVNPVAERGTRPPSGKQVGLFKTVIESYGMPVTVRKELGADIDAACGQLRRNSIGMCDV